MDEVLNNAPSVGLPALIASLVGVIPLGIALWKLLSGYHQNITKEYVEDNHRLRAENDRLDAKLGEVTRALFTQEQANSDLKIQLAQCKAEIAECKVAIERLSRPR